MNHAELGKSITIALLNRDGYLQAAIRSRTTQRKLGGWYVNIEKFAKENLIFIQCVTTELQIV